MRDASVVLIAAGISAAIHIGKLPPALPALREALGIGLVQAGFLISVVQLAGMALGVVIGGAADTLGPRRTVIGGLVVVTAASAFGGVASSASALLALRALEGLGFLMTVTPAPAMMRRVVPPDRLAPRLGLWASYMPVGTALAVLVGPTWVATWGWPAWWWAASLLSASLAVTLLRVLPLDPPRSPQAAAASAQWWPRIARTVQAPGPWLVALSFCVYAAQWLALIGFLPTLYAQAGFGPAAAGAAIALVALVNMVGTAGAGRLIHRGFAPHRLMQLGFTVMAIGGVLAYRGIGPGASGPALVLPYLGALCFSAVGGLVPGTLFTLSVRLAPSTDTVSTTGGWMMQWSAVGQFVGPPLIALVASRAGDWRFSGWVTGVFALVGLVLAQGIGALQRRAGPGA